MNYTICAYLTESKDYKMLSCKIHKPNLTVNPQTTVRNIPVAGHAARSGPCLGSAGPCLGFAGPCLGSAGPCLGSAGPCL